MNLGHFFVCRGENSEMYEKNDEIPLKICDCGL